MSLAVIKYDTNLHIINRIIKLNKKNMTTNSEILNKILEVMVEINERLKSDDNQLVNIARASAILGKSEGAIRQMVFRGQLNCTKLSNGRLAFNKRYLINYLDTRKA